MTRSISILKTDSYNFFVNFCFLISGVVFDRSHSVHGSTLIGIRLEYFTSIYYFLALIDAYLDRIL